MLRPVVSKHIKQIKKFIDEMYRWSKNSPHFRQTGEILQIMGETGQGASE